MFLGTRRVIVARRDELLHEESTDGVEAGLEALERWFTIPPRRSSVRLWLSGALCRVFVQEHVPGTRARDLQRIVEAEAPRRTGLAAHCVVWLEPRRGTQQRTAAAIEAGVLKSIYSWHDRQRPRMKLRGVHPWWSEALAAVHTQEPDCSALVIDDLESLTIFGGERDALNVAVSAAPVNGGPEAQSLRQRALFGLGLDAATVRTVTLLSVDSGAANATEVPFIALRAWVEQR
ncbi:hypothetical protein [Roseateles sp. LYH14W]|uniref:Uncharacterized protein n=1 Tax=Pelomonas parva TaxID=3299032 RepID=A0ABW7FBK0_9BURK